MEEITLNPLQLWLGAIGWTLVGILFVKALIYPFKKKFNFNTWLQENTLDVIRGVLLTLITVKLGDITIQLLTKYVGLDFSGITEGIKDAGLDPVQISLVIAIIFQLWLYKRRKKRPVFRSTTGNHPDPAKEEK